MSDTLPPGVLPMITNTDPPPMHPSTIVGDGFVGAPPWPEDTPYVTFDGTTATCTQGNWLGGPTDYAWQWQLDGNNVGTDAAAYTVQASDAGALACLVTASNSYGTTPAPLSNTIAVNGAAQRQAVSRTHAATPGPAREA